VIAIESVRARPVGATLFIDLAVAVSRALPLDRVSALAGEIRRAIQAEIPEAEVTITTLPKALDDESVLERVMVIARNRGCAVHHVTVHEVSGKLAVSIDLEVDGAMPLARAHEIASELEAAIAEEFGGELEVETHIEPLQSGGVAGRDAADGVRSAITALMHELVPTVSPLRDIHDVRVRETPQGLVVNFHCRTASTLSVTAVHEAVDALERHLREKRPDVHRVIGHAEPA
jgi:divalent metal cation (Fe/Co/Zn/Cd) transporter